MHLRNILAVLFLFLANICLASAEIDGAVVFVTMTTEVEVTSTVYLDTVTMTGHPTTTKEPDYVPLTTIYNSTWVEPTPTGTASLNNTAPTPSTPTKDSDSAATAFSASSIRVAAAAGAIVAVLGSML